MTDVLLGIDQSERRAVTQAETVLDLFAVEDLHVYLLHDFGENPEGASVVQVDAVQRARERLEAADVDVRFREASSGDPAQSIVAAADEFGVDAVCVAGRKRSPAGKVLFGSVSQAVILNTERPVLVCGTREG